MTVIGLSAAFFGFLYGCVFGLENVLPALWRRPHENITDTLFFAVGLGVSIILLSMCLHLFNMFRQKRWVDLFISPNGLAGMLFYGLVLLAVLKGAFNPWVMALAGLLLLLVVCKEPLTGLVEGKRRLIDGSVGMFVFKSILTLFETLLSYATNTVSFVRVGAFAVSHAGMMSVVLLLSRSVDGASHLVIFILGNLLVMAIEGLLVGIQVLRLDFYEMFSRFYKGGGKIFNATGRVSV
jgi:V/A-type H+-transporting ATPase subunit I